MKGLSRLPVTEEIAGSNPVESATKNTSPSSVVFFYGRALPVAFDNSAMILSMTHTKIDYKHIDLKIIALLRRIYLPAARFSIFLIFFWFGSIKLLGLSAASPLAEALTARTIGMAYFEPLFIALSVIECLIGILFLFPKLTRVVIPLLFVHMFLVCSPLILLPELVWQAPFIPTLEGQYIIKNAVVIALAIGIAASTQPLSHKK